MELNEHMFPDVVILAGGLGKRLHSVTGGAQKVLAKIGDQPFLEILIDYIASQGGSVLFYASVMAVMRSRPILKINTRTAKLFFPGKNLH